MTSGVVERASSSNESRNRRSRPSDRLSAYYNEAHPYNPPSILSCRALWRNDTAFHLATRTSSSTYRSAVNPVSERWTRIEPLEIIISVREETRARFLDRKSAYDSRDTLEFALCQTSRIRQEREKDVWKESKGGKRRNGRSLVFELRYRGKELFFPDSRRSSTRFVGKSTLVPESGRDKEERHVKRSPGGSGKLSLSS